MPLTPFSEESCLKSCFEPCLSGMFFPENNAARLALPKSCDRVEALVALSPFSKEKISPCAPKAGFNKIASAPYSGSPVEKCHVWTQYSSKKYSTLISSSFYPEKCACMNLKTCLISV